MNRQTRNQPVPEIKICGIRTLADVAIMNRYLPEYVGFIFTKSKRQIDPSDARQLSNHLAPVIRRVGVFTNESAETICSVMSICKLHIIQLHAALNPDRLAQLHQMMPYPVRIWQQVSVPAESAVCESGSGKTDGSTDALTRELANIQPFVENGFINGILLDTEVSGQSGGTGQTFDWNRILAIQTNVPLILAGGLHSENVSEAIRRVGPAIVDCSSGVEQNLAKIEEMVAAFTAVIRRKNVKRDDRMNINEQTDSKPGRFGPFGGQYAPETLMPALHELSAAYEEARHDPAFESEYHRLLVEYAGRPSLLYKAERLSEHLGLTVYLKREDLNHTGAHKINNVLGQILLAVRMGKKRVIAETGAGQHGVATATVAALMGLSCTVFMGEEDMNRQVLNVYRMRLLGAEVVSVSSGTATLKDATTEAMREWTRRVEDTFYVIGSAMGPHPYPTMVRNFQRVIGDEIKEQMQSQAGCLPSAVIACVGGGSNAIGSFYPFINEPSVMLIGAEAAGEGLDTLRHAATISKGSVGVFHGMKSLFLQDRGGQIMPVWSLSAGLDYPGVGPEHAQLFASGRAVYHAVTDAEAVAAFVLLSRLEGIIPAIESAHALALLQRLAPQLDPHRPVVVTLSGRGDKDVAAIGKYLGDLSECEQGGLKP